MIHKAEVTVIPNEEIQKIESPFTLGIFTFICMRDKLDFQDLYHQFGMRFEDEINSAIIELIKHDLITIKK